MPTLLIVDDDDAVRRSLADVLGEEGYRTLGAEGVDAARSILKDEDVDLVLLDVFLGDGNGLDLLREIKATAPDRAVVMISGESDIPTALQAIALGAFDFLEKPVGRGKLKVTVRNALVALERNRESRELRASQLRRWSFTGSSAALREVERVIGRAAQAAIPVLVTGENGTGKEIAAHRLHALSPRWARPFVAVNCAAIPGEILESELFGHVKGAFTGAIADKKGLFLEAHGGSLFLDEIGDMDVGLQAKLLRVLQEGEVTRVGETRASPVDVRVIAATNRSFRELVEEGRIREDLYYRLAGVEVVLPPLREHAEDVPELVKEIVERFCFENNRRIPRISDAAMAQLGAHPFPGNVRELVHIVQRTLLLSDADPVGSFLLPAGPERESDAEVRGPLADVKKDLMRRHLVRRLAAHRGDKKALAAELGVHPNNLYRMLREHGL